MFSPKQGEKLRTLVKTEMSQLEMSPLKLKEY